MTPEDRAAHWDAVAGRAIDRRNRAVGRMLTVIGLAVPLAFLAMALAAMIWDGGIWGLLP
jgi:hypothetical protein